MQQHDKKLEQTVCVSFNFSRPKYCSNQCIYMKIKTNFSKVCRCVLWLTWLRIYGRVSCAMDTPNWKKVNRTFCALFTNYIYSSVQYIVYFKLYMLLYRCFIVLFFCWCYTNLVYIFGGFFFTLWWRAKWPHFQR